MAEKEKATKTKETTKKKAVQEKTKQLAPNKLEMLVTIVNRNKAEFYADYIQSFEVNMQMIMQAEGTATEAMKKMLGLINTEKAVIFSIIQQSKINEVLDSLQEKFRTIKDGKGIAYTIPLTSVIGVAIYSFLSNNVSAVEG